MPSAVEAIESELADVRKKLAEFDDLKAQEERLVAALTILQGQSAPSTNGRSSARRPRRHRGRTMASVRNEQIIDAINAHGQPAGAAEIREALGLSDGDSNRLSVKLKRMVDAGALTKTGHRRSTRYSAG
jgi:hypothetical protein